MERSARNKDLLAGGILAGGRSSRMGRDKATLRVGKQSWLEYQACRMRYVVARLGLEGERSDFPIYCAGPAAGSCIAVQDVNPGSGPLGGILAILQAAQAEFVLIVAVDLLALGEHGMGWILSTWDRRTGFLPTLDGRLEPVCAIYPRAVLADLCSVWEEGERSVQRAIRATSPDGWVFQEVPDRLRENFRSLNTPDDLTWARQSAGLEVE